MHLEHFLLKEVGYFGLVFWLPKIEVLPGVLPLCNNRCMNKLIRFNDAHKLRWIDQVLLHDSNHSVWFVLHKLVEIMGQLGWTNLHVLDLTGNTVHVQNLGVHLVIELLALFVIEECVHLPVDI